MTGTEHYREAEKWLAVSHHHTDTGTDADTRIAHLAAQQATAHALLAQVAASVPAEVVLTSEQLRGLGL